MHVFNNRNIDKQWSRNFIVQEKSVKIRLNLTLIRQTFIKCPLLFSHSTTENSAINKADGSLWSHGRSLTINISIVQCKGMARAPVHCEYIKDCQLHLGNQWTVIPKSTWWEIKKKMIYLRLNANVRNGNDRG